MKSYIQAWRNYADIKGRASRAEYWSCVLVNTIILWTVALISNSEWLFLVFIFTTFIPSLKAGIRRMHDTGRSGWWLLVPVVSYVMLLQRGEARENRYGPPPSPSAVPA